MTGRRRPAKEAEEKRARAEGGVVGEAKAGIPAGQAAWQEVPAWQPVPARGSASLLADFRRVEGELRAGSLVVRPSLRAAAERFVVVFGTLAAVMVPFVIAHAVRTVAGADVDARPLPLGAFAALDIAFTFFVPVLVSLAPAVQLAFTRYVLDDEGIRERVQILSKTERRVQWEKVTALHHRRTLLDRIMGIERLDVVAYGERGTTIHMVGLRQARVLRGIVAREMRRQATLGHLASND